MTSSAFNEFMLILGVHIRTWFRGSATKGWKGYLKLAFSLLMILGFAVGVWFGSKGIFGGIYRVVEPFPALAGNFTLQVLMALALGNLILISMSTMNVVYSYIFESEDLAFLLSTPLSPRAIFGARFAESFLVCLLSVVPFGIIPAYAVGYVQGAGFVYYLVTLAGFAALIAFMLGLVSLLLLLIMRYVPGQKFKQLTMVFGLLVGLGIMFMTQMASYKSDMNGAQIKAMAESFAGMRLGDAWAAPHAWLAHASMTALGAEGTGYATTLLPLFVLGILAVTTVSYLATSAYLSGWSSSLEVGGGTAKAARVRIQAERRAARAAKPSLFKGQFMGLMEKEFILILREPVLWYNFLVGIIVVVFFMLNINGNKGGGQMPEDFKRYFMLFMLLFGSTVGGTQLAGTAISREGDSWSILRSFPIRAPQLFWAKAASAGLPSLALSLIGLVAVTIMRVGKVDPFPLYVSIPICLAFIGVLTLINISVDCLFPNFSYKLTTKKGTQGNGASGIKATVVSLGTMAYLFVLAATISLPTYYKEIGFMKGWSALTAKILGYSAFSVETVVIGVFLYFAAIRKLNRLLSDR